MLVILMFVVLQNGRLLTHQFNLDKALSARDFKSKLLLQVHDEIILDVPLEELDEIKALVKQTMEEAIELAVPLKVDENTGKTWYEAK